MVFEFPVMVVSIAVYAFHTMFAAIWAGSVIFVLVAVLPVAQRNGITGPDFQSILTRLVWITRISVFVTLMTGGHLAGTLYTFENLTGTMAGNLVLLMLGLWLILAILIEVGTARAKRTLDRESVPDVSKNIRPIFITGGLAALGLLVVAGLLGAQRIFGGL